MEEGSISDNSSLTAVQNRPLSWGVPHLPSNLVLRRRLFPKLSSAVDGGVTVMTGVPGSGKTALVSGWARYADQASVVWLSLRPDDNRDERIWERVRAELADVIGTGLSDGIRTGLSDGIGEDRLARSTSVPSGEHPVVLVIDNVEVITRDDLAYGFEDLIEALAGRIGLIIIGRNPARVPLHKLAMQVNLTEITADELACTYEEIAGLLAGWRSDPVPDEWVRTVSTRAEGWAGGIRLACLTLSELESSVDIAECLRTDWGLIADYFEKEILDPQSEDVREFLYRTSVLDEMRPDSCNAVTGRHDSLTVLEALTRQNLFIREAGATETFRYHRLFREFLRHQLALHGTDAEVSAHLLAARSLEQVGDPSRAMVHLNAAGAYDELFALGIKGIQRCLDVQHAVDPDTMLPAGIPATYFERSALRMYPLCVSHLLRLELDQAATWLTRMEWALDTKSDHDSPLRARCEFLWAIYDLALVNPEGVLRHFAASSSLLDAESTATFHRALRGHQWVRELDSALTLLAPMLVAYAEMWLGRPSRASQILSDAYGLDHAAGDPLLAAAFGPILLAEGQLGQAEELSRSALARIGSTQLGNPVPSIGIRMVMARVLYERDELEAAEEQLEAAERICREVGQDRWRTGIECELARLDLAHDRVHEALRRLDSLRRDELFSRNVPLRQLAQEIEVRGRLALGDLLGAEDILIDGGDGLPSAEILARFHLAAGRPDRASQELSRSGFTPRGRPSIERVLLQTRVFLQVGNRRAAEHSLQRAVNLAKADGFIRVFLDEPKQITDLLSAVSAGGADAFVQTLLNRVLVRPGGASAQPYILEPLTERERELLGYLPCHLSQSEIASKMFISANTVKTHMKGLYRKLGATSRSEAVYIARDCGLLNTTGV